MLSAAVDAYLTERSGFPLEPVKAAGIRANASGRTLMATLRPRRVSDARNTSPYPSGAQPVRHFVMRELVADHSAATVAPKPVRFTV